MSKPTRLQAFLARAGIASRRASEELIRDGRVLVNGETAAIGDSVIPGEDVVEVDGRVVRAQKLEWIALHKPRGYVTTRDDPSGRKTVYDLLPPELHHLFHVGRLDRESMGLLLLTNDGDGANRLLHPRYETIKEYLVDVEGEPDIRTLRQLVQGVPLEDGMAHAASAEVMDEVKPDIFRLRLLMREGRNREVRRMMEALGHPVRRLFRRSFGPVQVGRLRPGEWRHLSAEELQQLRGPGESADPRRPRGRARPGGAPGRAPRGGTDRQAPPQRGPRRPRGGGGAGEPRRGGDGEPRRGGDGRGGDERGRGGSRRPGGPRRSH